ncbi:helix-turn-helix transcriptional regulator [Streptomyces sp. NPDC046853]|uniref:helix-turn-helix domain-containing protein n=1 Tax=Streptomyces sp. NPDC046853 TaxID=3154920 RepID=UPI0033C73D91
MGLRTTISERQRRLGFELKQLREQKGLSAGEAAERIGMGRAQLSQIETAKTTILTSRLRELCQLYGCTNSTYVDGLVALSESTGKGWWSAYRNRIGVGALDLAELEAGSTQLRAHESLLIPGLLQTEEYTRAILASAKPAHGSIDDAVAFRTRRQHILTGDNPPTFHAVIHEGALRMRFGGPSVMRAQLLRLIELARLPHVTIQIFPYEADAYAAYTGNFLYARPSVDRLSTVVLEHPIASLHLGDTEHLAEYGALFDALTERALSPIDPQAAPETHGAKDSLALVQHVLYTF